jgi:hypothetical protein
MTDNAIPNDALEESPIDADAYTKSSVREALMIFARRYDSLQSKYDQAIYQLDQYDKALSGLLASKKMLDAAMLSETEQVFSSIDKMEKLALKDRPARLLAENDVYVYDLKDKKWKKQDNNFTSKTN